MEIMQTRVVKATLAQRCPETGDRNFIDGDNHDAGDCRLSVCCCVAPWLTSAARRHMSPRVVISSYHHEHACEQHSSDKTGGEYAEVCCREKRNALREARR